MCILIGLDGLIWLIMIIRGSVSDGPIGFTQRPFGSRLLHVLLPHHDEKFVDHMFGYYGM